MSNQEKLMDNLSKKLASNDKMLENINNRMDNFSTAIKNQISFNKMIESQLNKIAAAVPTTNSGIPSQPEGLESANLVDMFDAGNWSNPVTEFSSDRLPVKRGDPGRPVIPISIGMLADRTLSFPKGILKNLRVQGGHP